MARLDADSGNRGTLVDKALAAERDGLWGRVYIDQRGPVPPGLRLGEEWLRGAAEICHQLGLETVVDTNEAVFAAEFPLSHVAFYAGWYREHVTGALAQPKVEFMPGAFAYHLHSFSGANLHSATQQWVGPLLARGATITMGSVDEPYLGGTPDLATFAARLIFHGFSFGEAAYASQNALSWQTTVVGDPLYRPFGRRPQDLHRDLEARGNPLVAWSHLRLMNLNLARQVPPAEVVSYLEGLALTRTNAVLLEKLGDLYAAQGKPASAAHAYAQALQYGPSPQQRVRLSLGLAERLIPLDRQAEAFTVLEDLLKQCPDYPAPAAIQRQLLALAKQLGRAKKRLNTNRRWGFLPPRHPPTKTTPTEKGRGRFGPSPDPFNDRVAGGLPFTAEKALAIRQIQRRQIHTCHWITLPRLLQLGGNAIAGGGGKVLHRAHAVLRLEDHQQEALLVHRADEQTVLIALLVGAGKRGFLHQIGDALIGHEGARRQGRNRGQVELLVIPLVGDEKSPLVHHQRGGGLRLGQQFPERGVNLLNVDLE